MKQALSQRTSVTQQEALAILSSPASANLPRPCQCIPPQRKCPQSATSASRSVWGPPAPGPCTNSDFAVFPATLAPSLQMAFVWDLQGATLAGPSPRAKSRLRFSKSYRYRLFTFCGWQEFFSSSSVALGSLQKSFCPALIFFLFDS